MSRKPVPIKRQKPGWKCKCGQLCDPHWRFCARCETRKPVNDLTEEN